jgi:type IV secretory pathway TrbL component
MAQPVIITGGAPEGDTTTAFAAGVATVVASEASETADQAAADAATALSVAENAASTAYATQDDLAALRGDIASLGDRFMETLGAVIELINGEGDGPGEDDGAPEIVVDAEKVVVHKPDDGDPDKDKDSKPTGSGKKPKGFGSNWWFGDKR